MSLLDACKDGLRIMRDNTTLDGVIGQKIATVKGFMMNAGVSQAQLDSELGTGTIVMGVLDIFGIESGEIKFSSVFHMFVTQLALKSNDAEGG